MKTAELKAFLHQIKTAKERGIRFYFKFEEWVKWWENHLGPRWFELRGRCGGKYVMARVGDKGSYTWWNVECVLFEDNCRARKVNNTTAYGERQHLAKITSKIAKKIFLAKGNTYELGKRFGVSRDIVQRIKTGKTWCRATNGLGEAPRLKNRRLNNKIAASIFMESGSVGSIARKFNRSYPTVWDIKHKKIWVKATEGLTAPPEQLWGRSS